MIRPQDLTKWLGAWLDIRVELLGVVELAAGGRAVMLQVREGEPGQVFVELVDSVIVGQYAFHGVVERPWLELIQVVQTDLLN